MKALRWLLLKGSIRIFVDKAVEQFLSPCLGELITEHNGKLIHGRCPIDGGTHWRAGHVAQRQQNARCNQSDRDY